MQGVLCAACCLWRAACGMLLAACSLLLAPCCLLLAACSLLLAPFHGQLSSFLAANSQQLAAFQAYINHEKQALEHIMDLANSWYMARGHLNRNWFRTYLATKAGGKYALFVDWLCGTGTM